MYWKQGHLQPCTQARFSALPHSLEKRPSYIVYAGDVANFQAVIKLRPEAQQTAATLYHFISLIITPSFPVSDGIKIWRAFAYYNTAQPPFCQAFFSEGYLEK